MPEEANEASLAPPFYFGLQNIYCTTLPNAYMIVKDEKWR